MNIFEKIVTKMTSSTVKGGIDKRTKLGKAAAASGIVSIYEFMGLSSANSKGGLLVLAFMTVIILDIISYLQMMIFFGWENSFSLIYLYSTPAVKGIFMLLIFICLWSCIPLILYLGLLILFEASLILIVLITMLLTMM